MEKERTEKTHVVYVSFPGEVSAPLSHEVPSATGAGPRSSSLCVSTLVHPQGRSSTLSRFQGRGWSSASRADGGSPISQTDWAFPWLCAQTHTPLQLAPSRHACAHSQTHTSTRTHKSGPQHAHIFISVIRNTNYASASSQQGQFMNLGRLSKREWGATGGGQEAQRGRLEGAGEGKV